MLHIPAFLGELIPVALTQGFTLHHAKGEEIVMSRWLQTERPSKLPNYASHQVGVCGELAEIFFFPGTTFLLIV